MMHVAQGSRLKAQVWRAQRTFHIISCVIFVRSCCVFDSPRLLHFPLLAVYLLSYRPFFSSWPSASSSTMWWTNSFCTPADEDLGKLAEYDPLTGYEPNDHQPRSEKMMRAVDELITLMTKVCCPVSRRLSVIERRDPLWNSLTH